MTLPAPRINWYTYSNIDDIAWSIRRYINQFLEDAGPLVLQADLPVLQEMESFSLSLVLFSLTFRVVITIFIVISALLIYSLLMIGIDNKTLEIGIMRMVGISKIGLVFMVFLQAVIFVIPAIILGFALSIPLLALCYT